MKALYELLEQMTQNDMLCARFELSQMYTDGELNKLGELLNIGRRHGYIRNLNSGAGYRCYALTREGHELVMSDQ